MLERTNAQWLEALTAANADEAIADLRLILLRGLRYALANRGLTEADLEDFVQDGMLRILQELPSFRGDSRFTTWAQKVVVHVALTELRRKRWRDVSLDELMSASDSANLTPAALINREREPSQVAAVRAMMALVQRIIAEELTERQRDALLALMVGGMPMQEVAERLGTNRNALYKLLHDGRKRLQKRIAGEGLSVDEILRVFDEV